MELLTLSWDQINFEQGIIILYNRTHLTKGKKIRTVPLNEKSIGILKSQKDLNFEHRLVFRFQGITNREKYIQNNFKNLVKNAHINKSYNFHSLRHTFVSWLVQAGVSIYEVSKLLGHSDIKTTQIYAHLTERNLRNAVELL